MTSKSYVDLIEEVYIEPLRSVLIVDDDYPTWDEILLPPTEDTEEGKKLQSFYSKKKWHKDPEPIKKLIAALRAPNHSLILDIQDGSTQRFNEDLISNLHHTDLLILDYQLDGTSQDGTKSINVLRQIKANKHFNLVIVQTGAKLDVAFPDMLLGLLSPVCLIDEAKTEQAITLIQEVEETIDEGVLEKLQKSIDRKQYFSFREDDRNAFALCRKGAQPFTAFHDICVAHGWEGGDFHTMFVWSISDFEKRFEKQMHTLNIDNLTWSVSDPLWIRSSHAFIVFSEKEEAADLIEDLRKGLDAWAPRPSRLLLAKLRKELEERGTIAEDSALGNNHVLARWYLELLNSNEDKQTFLLQETLNRHSEQLLAEVSENVVEFSKLLIGIDKATKKTAGEIVSSHFKIDLDDNAVLSKSEFDHNVFVCSTTPQGHHLRTGQIFMMEDEYWICLSPLCDLVPGQKTGGIFKDAGSRKPFLGVRLRTVSKTKSEEAFSQITDIQSNRYLFIRHGDKNLILCINEPDPQKEDSAPHWYPLYASDQGRFKKGTLDISVSKIGVEEDNLIFKSHDTTVISQLRYEYALNLMQKLGANLNRIGLDFSGRAPEPPASG